MRDNGIMPGDIVRLVTGSEPMTAASENDNGIVTCIWWDKGRAEVRQAAIPAAALIREPGAFVAAVPEGVKL